jgi:membrane AbrB-like protein
LLSQENITGLALAVVVGTVCGVLFKKFKMPAGYMIGAFVGVATFNVTTGLAWLPPDTKTAVQMIAGAFVGCSMERSDLARLRRSVLPLALMIASFLVLNILIGMALYLTSPLDLVTSLMCAVPGGINDTPIVAADMGADAPVVAVMQLIRQVLGIGVFPLMIAALEKARPEVDDKRAVGIQTNTTKRKKSKQKSWGAIVAAITVAIGAGLLGKLSGVPGMTFAMSIIAVLILKLGFDFAYIPKKVKKACQIVAGCYLGTLVTLGSIIGMTGLVIPICILIAGYTLNCLITGKLESKLFGYSRSEGMLIASPAGASDMALIIEDLGVKNTDVVIMQVVRAVVVMTLFPQIINLVCILWGG